jgi:hypothetical protein
MAKKLKKISILEIFSKVEVQKLNVCACLTRSIKPKKNNLGYTLVGSLTRTLDQKLPLLTKKKFLQKLTLNILHISPS